MRTGLIFDIKRYAINDGPGIRVTIFLKGCHLNCTWCHNPESISPKVQKMYSNIKCIGCSTCVEACPEKAITLTPDGIITNPELCKLCGKCAEVCPTGATEMSGEEKTVDELLEVIEEERLFFDQSGGGVTISGGEPLMHSKFLLELLEACRERGIHTTVDTTGNAPKETLLQVAEKTDLFLYDLKMMNSEKHKKWTGVGNDRILENLIMLAEDGAEINIRIPLIKGVNDDNDNIEESAKFISALDGDKKKVNILPFHNIAQKKYDKLGQDFDMTGMAEPSKEEQLSIISKFEEYGLTAVIGG